MPVVLALETTSDVCSVAVGTRENHTVQSRIAPRQHNKLVLHMVDDVCNSLDIQRQAIDCVAFSSGPGSFTGVRLGAAIAQAIAYGIDAMIYGVPTSLVMAERLVKSHQVPKKFVTQRISRRDLVYSAKISLDGASCRFDESDQLINRSTSDFEEPVFSDETTVLSAIDVHRLALINQDRWRPPGEALPIYVEGDHPWQPQQ